MPIRLTNLELTVEEREELLPGLIARRLGIGAEEMSNPVPRRLIRAA